MQASLTSLYTTNTLTQSSHHHKAQATRSAPRTYSIVSKAVQQPETSNREEADDTTHELRTTMNVVPANGEENGTPRSVQNVSTPMARVLSKPCRCRWPIASDDFTSSSQIGTKDPSNDRYGTKPREYIRTVIRVRSFVVRTTPREMIQPMMPVLKGLDSTAPRN